MKAGSVWICLGALAVSPATVADDSGVYIGAGVGHIDMPRNVGLGVPNVPMLSGKREGTDFAPGMDIGYRFNRNIAVELGYANLGDLDAKLVDADGGTDANAQTEFSADGVSLALVGTFPIAKWEPYVKAGVLFSSTTLKYSGSVSGNAFNGNIDNDAEDPIYGLGVRYNLTERIKIYVDSTYFSEVGDPSHGQADFLKTSAGVIWQF